MVLLCYLYSVKKTKHKLEINLQQTIRKKTERNQGRIRLAVGLRRSVIYDKKLLIAINKFKPKYALQRLLRLH